MKRSMRTDSGPCSGRRAGLLQAKGWAEQGRVQEDVGRAAGHTEPAVTDLGSTPGSLSRACSSIQRAVSAKSAGWSQSQPAPAMLTAHASILGGTAVCGIVTSVTIV
jgi:hypothetical protein